MKMKMSSLPLIFFLTIIAVFFLSSNTTASSLPERLLRSTAELRNHTAISDFRLVNRRRLAECPDPNPYLKVNVTSDPTLPDDGYVTVNITGVLVPSRHDWVAMISPSHSKCGDASWLIRQLWCDLTPLVNPFDFVLQCEDVYTERDQVWTDGGF